jgi:hypothetical protein
VPFHKRNVAFDEMMSQEADFVLSSQSLSSSNFNASPAHFKTSPESGNVPQQTQQQQSSTTQLNTSFSHPAAGTVDSPHSGGAPSPLAAPQVAPSANPNNADMTMPTLSPHPPSKNASADKDPSQQHSENHTGAATSASSQAAVSAASAPGDIVTVVSSSKHSGPSASSEGSMVTVSTLTPWLDSQLLKHSRPLPLKRPALPINGYDQTHAELVTESLYNFESLNDWYGFFIILFNILSHSVSSFSRLDQPVKKIKMEIENPGQPASNGFTPFDPVFLSQDSASPMPRAPAHDPYEFSDESSSNAGSAFGNKMNRRPSKDDPFSRPSPFGGNKVSP